MTTVLHAQPYDLAATGFYFETPEAFQSKAKANRNDYCDPVEEYEIQFIDGDDVDCDLANSRKANPDWQPRYMAFPMQGYTKRQDTIAPRESRQGYQRGAECRITSCPDAAVLHRGSPEKRRPMAFTIGRHCSERATCAQKCALG